MPVGAIPKTLGMQLEAKYGTDYKSAPASQRLMAPICNWCQYMAVSKVNHLPPDCRQGYSPL